MKKAPKIQQKQGHYSSLSAAELLALIAEKETPLQEAKMQPKRTLLPEL